MPKSLSKDPSWREEVTRPWAGKWERMGRTVLYRLAQALVPRRDPAEFSLASARKILLIKEPYRMGDLMQITPTLRALKNQLPQVHLGLLIQDRNQPIFQNNPNIDRLFVYRKKDFNARPWKILAFL